MSCKHALVDTQQIPQLGGSPIIHRETLCRLKMRGQQEQLAVYDRLFQLGLEGSMLSDVCPVAGSGQWAKCPFRE